MRDAGTQAAWVDRAAGPQLDHLGDLWAAIAADARPKLERAPTSPSPACCWTSPRCRQGRRAELGGRSPSRATATRSPAPGFFRAAVAHARHRPRVQEPPKGRATSRCPTVQRAYGQKQVDGPRRPPRRGLSRRRYGAPHGQPPRRRDQPLPAPARRQPGRLVPVGRRGVRPGPGRGPAGPAVGRLLGLPLVPRHGPRVLRGRRHRGPDERAVRQREGRPRGATRRRRHLHGRRPGHDRPRRLAHDRVPHARRQPVLRRHLLPERAPPRHAVVPRRAPGRRRRLAGAPRRRHRAGRAPHRGRGPQRRRSRPSDVPGAGGRSTPRCARRCGRQHDDEWGGFGQAPEVPPDDEPRAAAAGPRPRPATPTLLERRRHLARRHGVGRHLRPPRRRLRPLLGRRPLAGAPLREDALRPGAAGPGLPPRLAGHRRGPLPPGARRDVGYVLRDLRHADGGFYSAEDADSEGEEGKLLRLAARRDPRGARATGPTLAVEWYGVTPGQLRGVEHPPPAGARRPRCARPRSRRPGRRCSQARERGCGPASTTRCSPSGTR